MYNKSQLALKYIHYYITAANGKGHGVHSPFVFDFITNVLNDRRNFYAFSNIEYMREQLLHSTDIIEVQDFGAGSSVMQQKTRKVSDIAKWSLKSRKYAQLLFRMVNYYQPETIIELGTSLGITTAYLASANRNASVYSFEGADAIAERAKAYFNKAGLQNIQLIKGNFDNTFLPALQKIKRVDFAFIDGNHRKEPALRYFNQLLPCLHNSSIVIFDDIHWSREMEEAWETIKLLDCVTCSIDLFFIGIILISKDFKATQDFVVRF
ncbi:MAG: class I SAM-dependent methyltransferase [Terrimonas sp.]|nr:class I SAM-dependent methyltransferase [Terrimonas sp.]OJY82422.1 MAG: SAM-dependent methyltransferase [Sphingobacteriales bacterium 40-81]